MEFQQQIHFFEGTIALSKICIKLPCITQLFRREHVSRSFCIETAGSGPYPGGFLLRLSLSRVTHLRTLPPVENSWACIISKLVSGNRTHLYSNRGLRKKVFRSRLNQFYSANFYGLHVNSEFEMESLYSYLVSNVVCDLFALGKDTEDVCLNSFRFIPLVPLDRIWDDDTIKDWIIGTCNPQTGSMY